MAEPSPSEGLLRTPVLAWLRLGRGLGGVLPLAASAGVRHVTDVELGQALSLGLVRVHETFDGRLLGFKLTSLGQWYLARVEGAEEMARAAATRVRAARDAGS